MSMPSSFNKITLTFPSSFYSLTFAKKALQDYKKFVQGSAFEKDGKLEIILTIRSNNSSKDVNSIAKEFGNYLLSLCIQANK
jgi:hypothetical protein